MENNPLIEQTEERRAGEGSEGGRAGGRPIRHRQSPEDDHNQHGSEALPLQKFFDHCIRLGTLQSKKIIFLIYRP